MPWVNSRQMKTVKQILTEYANQNNIKFTNDDDLINKTMNYMFDFEMPSYVWVNYSNTKQFGDETYYLKKTLLQNYMYDTIGFRSVDKFKSRLQNALRILLPYYNQILWSEQWPKMFIENPAANTDYKEIYTRIVQAVEDNENTTASSNNTNNTSKNKQTTNSTNSSSDTTNSQDVTEGTQKNDVTSKDESGSTSSNKSNNIDNDYPKAEINEDEIALGNYASLVNTSSSNNEGKTNTQSTQTNASNNTENVTSNSTTRSEGTADDTSIGESTSETIDSLMSKFNENKKNKSNENYEFRRVGNIGVQTPGEVFENTRKAFINTIDLLIHDKMIVKLFSFLIYDEEDDFYDQCYY